MNAKAWSKNCNNQTQLQIDCLYLPRSLHPIQAVIFQFIFNGEKESNKRCGVGQTNLGTYTSAISNSNLKVSSGGQNFIKF
jgi:hypothetical protein